jgi:hypothetical protein
VGGKAQVGRHWVIVAEHGYRAAGNSDFPWQTLNDPNEDRWTARRRGRSTILESMGTCTIEGLSNDDLHASRRSGDGKMLNHQ